MEGPPVPPEVLDPIARHLLQLVTPEIDPNDVVLIKKLAMGSGCCCT